MVNWLVYDLDGKFLLREVTSIEDMPKEGKNAYGFVYKLEYEDGTYYIGKKNFYNIKRIPQLKKGKRGNVIETKGRNVKGKRVYYDVIEKESNWKVYNGSHKNLKGKEPVRREILEFAFNKLELTYLEVKNQFAYHCLESEKCLNDNILGKFYRSRLSRTEG